MARSSQIEQSPIVWTCACGSNQLSEVRNGTISVRVVGKSKEGSLLFGHSSASTVDPASDIRYACEACGGVVHNSDGTPVSSRAEMKKLA